MKAEFWEELTGEAAALRDLLEEYIEAMAKASGKSARRVYQEEFRRAYAALRELVGEEKARQIYLNLCVG